MAVIETERLILRPAVPADAEEMHAVMSDPVAMRYWSTVAHVDLAETQAWIGKMIEGPGHGTADFLIEHDGVVIGKAGGWMLPEVGYILARSHWGRGLGQEAMRALIAHIFATHDIPALTADVDPRNAASLRLMERLGFRETHRAERTWHIGGEYCDSVYFRLDRPGI